MSAFDPVRLRADFPILEREVNGRPLAYLDHAASSQKPRAVLEALRTYYERHHANVHRGAHTLSAEATEQYEAARETAASFLGAPEARSLVFVRNATEGLNLFARAWGDAHLGPGDEILVTVLEHHANLVPWQQLAQRTGARVRAAGLTPEGRLDLEDLRGKLGPRTRVVAVSHMSNVLGTVQPVARIAAWAHEVGATVVVDGAQAASHRPVDVTALGADAYAVSGHKTFGPTGVGALWVRSDLLEAMPPFLGGGEMIEKVEIERSTYADIPARFEAGTPAIAEAIAWAEALRYLRAIGMDAVWEHGRALGAYAREALDAVDGVTTFGPLDPERGGIVPFTLDEVHPHDVATALDAEGIAVRAGHHCAQPLMRAFGVPAMARASVHVTTTREELDRLAEALVATRDFFHALA